MTSSIAASRLMKELKALEAQPLVRGNASPYSDDIFNWKLIVIGEAPYDFPIRIHLQYSEDYPNVAPKAFFESVIYYTGGATIYDDRGRQAVCLNIFGNFAMVHTEWSSQQAGWTPAYNIETIITSIQGLMIDMLSTDPQHVRQSRAAALAFKCGDTGHDGSNAEKYFPSLLLSAPTTAPSKAAASTEEQQYVCYVNKELPVSKYLGFGIGVEGKATKSFTSPCEFMSIEAYNGGVRKSSTNKVFTFWMPIITPYKSWDDVKDMFYDTIKKMCVWLKLPFDAVKTPVTVCCSLMNSLVVEIMNAKNNLTANDKFIDGYFFIFRLLREHAASKPSAVKFAAGEIEKFITKKENRTKECIPNLGEFILYPLCTPDYSWKHFCDAFVAECDARCVFWYVQGTGHAPGRYPELMKREAPGRCEKVFGATEISRNLVCYQKQFLTLAKGLAWEDVEANRMFVPEEMKTAIKNMYKGITAIKDWNDYFDWLEMDRPLNRNQQLIDAVNVSGACGYHRGGR